MLKYTFSLSILRISLSADPYSDDGFGNIDSYAYSDYGYGNYDANYKDSDSSQYDPSHYDNSYDPYASYSSERSSNQQNPTSASNKPSFSESQTLITTEPPMYEIIDEQPEKVDLDTPYNYERDEHLNLEQIFAEQEMERPQEQQHPSRQQVSDLYVGTEDTQKRPALLWTKKSSNLNNHAANADPDQLLLKMQQNVNIDMHFGSMLNLLNYLISLQPMEIRRKRRDDGSGSMYITAEDIVDYGCWCSRIPNLIQYNSTSHAESHGGKPLDAIDRVCRDWFKCQKCVTLSHTETLEDGETDMCDGSAGHTGYLVGVVMDEPTGEYQLTCDDPANYVRPCARDACSCGGHFVEKIVENLSAWNPNYSRHNSLKMKDGANLQYCIKPSGYQYALAYESSDDRHVESDFGNSNESDDFIKEQRIIKCCGQAPSWQPYVEQRHQCCEQNGSYKLRSAMSTCDNRL